MMFYFGCEAFMRFQSDVILKHFSKINKNLTKANTVVSN